MTAKKMKSENIPTLLSYGDYSSSNLTEKLSLLAIYGAHCMMLKIPPSNKNKYGITLYFSYSTLIAFRGFINEEKCGLFTVKNTFSNTTGKHLNFIDGGRKEKRLEYNAFIKLFNKAIKNA